MNREILLRIPVFLFVLLLLNSCGDILSNGGELEPIDWQNGDGIIAPDENNLSDAEKEAYTKSAEKLAVRYMETEDSTKIEIPEALIDVLYNGLVHLAQSDDPKTREVTEDYDIQARSPADPRSVDIYVENSAPWFEAWENGSEETGNEAVDTLMTNYNLSVAEITEHSGDRSTAHIHAEEALNVYALGRLFEAIEGVLEASTEKSGDGNEIRFMFFRDHIQFLFKYGYGDCPAGCINEHTWYFNVFKDGSVQFAGEEGDPLEN